MKKLLATTALACLVALMAIPFAMADFSAVTSTASITNAAPTVGEVTATDPVSLSESTNVTVWCNATVTDTNGYADVSTVSAKLWDPAATTEGGSDDYNNHYTNSSCSLSGGSGTTVSAACRFNAYYSANAAEWTCKLTATDGSLATGTANVTTVTVNQLKALSIVSATMAFSELALGATSSDYNMSVNNTGNTQIDVSVDGYGAGDGDGYAMTCTIGGSEISLSNLKYNLTVSQDYTANMTALTDSAVTLSDFNLAAETTDGAGSTNSIYWKLKIPSTDVGGSCSGNVVITAV